jgi:hypothetical protein
VLGVLQPTRVTVMPYANSSNLLSTLCSLLGFAQYTKGVHGRRYTFVVLTRHDLQMKQAITALPGLQATDGYDLFHFAYLEGRSDWRARGQRNPCADAFSHGRVSDVLHTFGGDMLPCVLRAFEHYLLYEKEQLHYLHASVRRFAAGEIRFLVPGCYDSNPAHGQRNPLYDIAPRNGTYNNSVCTSLEDFAYETLDTLRGQLPQYCCQSETYCCPTSATQCPPRQRAWPWFVEVQTETMSSPGTYLRAGARWY